jgi:hypothetical protein
LTTENFRSGTIPDLFRDDAEAAVWKESHNRHDSVIESHGTASADATRTAAPDLGTPLERDGTKGGKQGPQEGGGNSAGHLSTPGRAARLADSGKKPAGGSVIPMRACHAAVLIECSSFNLRL